MLETKGFSFSPGTGARFVEATPVPLRFVDGKSLVPDSGVDILAKGAAQAAENLLSGVKIGVAGIESGVKTGVEAFTERLKAKEHNDLLREMYGDRDEIARQKLALSERQLSDREAGIIGGRSGSSKTPVDYSAYGLGDPSNPVALPQNPDEQETTPTLFNPANPYTPATEAAAAKPPSVASATPPTVASTQDAVEAPAENPFQLRNLKLTDFQAVNNPGLDMAQGVDAISQDPSMGSTYSPRTQDLQEAQLRLMGAGYDTQNPTLAQAAAPSENPTLFVPDSSAPALQQAAPPQELPASVPAASTPQHQPTAPARAPIVSPFIKVPIAGPDGQPSGYVYFDKASRKLIPASHVAPVDDASSAKPPEGWQARGMTINGGGKVTRTFLSPEEVQKEQDSHKAADDLHQANLHIKQERLAQTQRDGYSKDVAVKTYTGPNGAQQALAAFVPAFNEANDPHNTSKSSSEMSMLDQLVRAETGGKPTETQIHTIRSNMPLKEKLATLFGKNYSGDFLGKNMYESLAQQIVGNAANKAKIANGTIEGIRQSYVDQGLEPPKQLKPFVVPMTVKDVNDEISKIRNDALPLANQYDALVAKGQSDSSQAKELRKQLEEHQAEAVRLGKMKANAKHFIVNLDDFLDTSKQGWKGVAVEALTPQAPTQ